MSLFTVVELLKFNCVSWFIFGRRLLESLLILLSSPQTGSDPAVFSAVRDLLLYLASFQQGQYVYSESLSIFTIVL